MINSSPPTAIVATMARLNYPNAGPPKSWFGEAFTIAILSIGVAHHACEGGPPSLAASLLGGLFGSGCLIALYLLGAVGIGEVGAMAAVGAWLGLPLADHLFVAGSVISGTYA